MYLFLIVFTMKSKHFPRLHLEIDSYQLCFLWGTDGNLFHLDGCQYKLDQSFPWFSQSWSKWSFGTKINVALHASHATLPKMNFKFFAKIFVQQSQQYQNIISIQSFKESSEIFWGVILLAYSDNLIEIIHFLLCEQACSFFHHFKVGGTDVRWSCDAIFSSWNDNKPVLWYGVTVPQLTWT